MHAVWELEPVGLPELEGDASLLTRRDRKYLVPRTTLDLIMGDLRSGARVLEIDGIRTFTYESVYFDTLDLTSYMAAAHGRPRRFKVRTRNYVDSAQSQLELKTRDRRGLTVKHRMPYHFEDRVLLTHRAIEFLETFEQTAEVARSLHPTLRTRYLRTTLLDDSSCSRVTIDTNMACTASNGSTLACPDLAIIETKTTGGPCRVDHLLWSQHIRPAKVSKYCTSLAALEPSLPSNKWRPVLRTHFDTAEPAVSALQIA